MPILNVDDNAASRFLRSRILERAGYDVREAASAGEALAFCKSAKPELVLLDVALPDDDGFTVCEGVKAAHPAIPVVMITTVYQTAHARRDGFAAGADEYLLDPIEPDRLVDAIRRFLDPSHIDRRLEPATIITDDYGLIVSANAAAARLLNLTPRGIRDRSLLAFCEGDRPQVSAHMRKAVAGQVVQLTTTLRPRDRRPFKVRLDVSAAPFERGGSLEWVLEPLRDERT